MEIGEAQARGAVLAPRSHRQLQIDRKKPLAVGGGGGDSSYVSKLRRSRAVVLGFYVHREAPHAERSRHSLLEARLPHRQPLRRRGARRAEPRARCFEAEFGLASKDEVRFYLNDVFSRLKIGKKREALLAFNEVAREYERHVKVGLEIDGFVNLIVCFLDSHETEAAEEAVSSIAGIPPGKAALVSAASELCKEFAARCMVKMTENSDNVWAVSAHGGVPALLKICTGAGDSGTHLVSLACGVLKNLAAVEEIKRFMVEDGAVAALITLAGSRGGEEAKISALVLGNILNREEIITQGGIRTLVGIMDPAKPGSTKTREAAFRCITTICSSSVTSCLASGFADHILHFLIFGELLSKN